MEIQKSPISKIKSVELLKSILNLLIFGVGIGVITGSLLKTLPQILDKDNNNISGYSKNKINLTSLESYKKENELDKLSLEWERLRSDYSDLKISGFAIHENGKFSQINPKTPLPAASSIKIFILLLCLEMIDNGILKWDENLTLSKDIIAEGSGWMRYQPIGKKFPLHEVATEMIRVSDNTATNLLIMKLGGIKYINERLIEIGFEGTKLNNLLPDLSGTNKTTTEELTMILRLANQTKFLSTKSRDLFRDIMSTSTSNRLIPGGLLNGLQASKTGTIDYSLLIEGFKVLNKTGDIGISYADAAIIQMPSNSNIFASFIVQGPFNDPRSTELIRKMAASLVSLREN